MVSAAERGGGRHALTPEAAGEAGHPRGRRAARWLSAAVFGGLLAALLLSSVPYGAVEARWTAAVSGAVFLLAALWAVEGAVSGGWLRRSHLVVVPGLALAAFAFLQSLPLSAGGALSFDPYETRLTAARLLAVTLYAALLIRYAETERRLRALVYVVVATGLASALFGLARQATQRGEQGFLLEYLTPGSGYAQFINKNHFAFLAEMALGLLLGLVAGGGVARRRALVPLALALPVWAALVLSNSRGSVFAMLCQVIFLGATFGVTRGGGLRGREGTHGWGPGRLARSPLLRVPLIALLLLTVVVGMVWLGGDPLTDRVVSVREEAAGAEATDPSASGRRDIWRATWEMFKDHPAAGVGLGGYWVAVSRYHEGSGRAVPQQAHNDYLELLASGGVIGFAMAVAFVYLLVRWARARLREGTPFARAAALGALAGLFGVAVHSLVEFGLHVPANALAAAALVAVAAAEVRGSKGGEISQKTSRQAY